MPELPEVETVLRGLEQVFKNHVITKIETHRKNLRTNFPSQFAEKIVGQQVVKFTRRAKYMLLTLSNHNVLIIHLGMSGSFRIENQKNNKNIIRGKHDHVSIILNDGTVIFYNDPRRFGVMDVVHEDNLKNHVFLAELGVEPLDDTFTGEKLFDLLKTRKMPIKQAIMDQKIVVGVGNIYACESLFASKISPLRPANTINNGECALLVKNIKKILNQSIIAGGTTLRDHKQVDGSMGEFASRLAVYGAEGKPCLGCDCDIQKTGGIKRITQGSRSTFYCPQKQV